jgi:nitrogen regulatory protein P-II 1
MPPNPRHPDDNGLLPEVEHKKQGHVRPGGRNLRIGPGCASARKLSDRTGMFLFLCNRAASARPSLGHRLVLQRRMSALWAARARTLGPLEKGSDVKLIIAAIKPFKLDEVREALTAIGVRGMMVTEIKGFGTQSGHTEIYRGAEYAVNFVPKMRLEIVVADALADQVVGVIGKTARTGKIGDGKIFVLDVSHAVRVRTGEIDDDAL